MAYPVGRCIYCSGDGMFHSVKLKNVRITVFSLACLVIFVAVCLLALRAGAPDTVEIGGDSYSLRAVDDEDIEAFLRTCGYEPEGLVSETEITVPKIWNDTYTRYNDLQSAQGLDLTPYKGKPARELVYACADGDRVITLLTADDRIIAAHTADSDGSHMERLIDP